jgi:hypothetical protein
LLGCSGRLNRRRLTAVAPAALLAVRWQAQSLQLLCLALLVRLLGLAGPSARPVPKLAGVPMVANLTVAAPRLPLKLTLACALALALA